MTLKDIEKSLISLDKYLNRAVNKFYFSWGFSFMEL